MFQFQGIWLPDGEKHFPEWMEKNGEIVDGRGTYQIKKWRACLPWIKNWRLAIDVGAHVGFWSIQMAAKFETVEAFEPVDEFRSCWSANLVEAYGDGGHNAICYPEALGASDGYGDMCIPMMGDGIDSGGTWCGITSKGKTRVRPLDSYGFVDVDFIKIDVEGGEHLVVEGARETLKRWRPCVIVEQKPHKLGPNFGIEGTPAVDLLREMGAFARTCISGDWICSWD